MTQPNDEPELDIAALIDQKLQESQAATDTKLAAIDSILRDVVANTRKTEPEPPDPLADADDTNPLVQLVKSQKARLDQLEPIVRQQLLTKQQQDELAAVMRQIHKVADVAGVDFAGIEGELQALPLDVNWWEGAMGVIEKAKQPPETPDRVSLFTQRRGGGQGRAASFDQIEQAYVEGRISTEEYAAARNKHRKE